MNVKQMLIQGLYRTRNVLFFHGYGKIGSMSCIIKPMRIIGKRKIFVGDHCTILNHARMETISRWKVKQFNGSIHIGNYTSIEQNCHIIAADKLEIGDHTVISAFVYIADCGHSIDDTTKSVMEQPLFVKRTKIGAYCFIGIGAKIMPGVEIGDHAVVGAGTVVTKDVPPYTMVVGSPAKIIKKYNLEDRKWESVNN